MGEINIVESERFELGMFHLGGTTWVGEKKTGEEHDNGVNKCEQSGMGENIVIHVMDFLKFAYNKN